MNEPLFAAGPWQDILSGDPKRERLPSSPDHGPSDSREPAALRVLVAEDNEFNSELLVQLLARRGHRVRLANTGREALRLVEEGGHDLLLLDVHMPELAANTPRILPSRGRRGVLCSGDGPSTPQAIATGALATLARGRGARFASPGNARFRS